MKKFSDALQREWAIDLTVLDLERVQKAAEFDLMSVAVGDGAAELQHPVQLLAVLWALLESQCRQRDVTFESLCHGFYGDALHDALLALRAELNRFLPASQRALAEAILEKSAATSAAITRAGMEKLAAIDPQQLAAQVMADLLRRNSGASSTSSPESSASIPAAGPSTS
ncbi:hypothetical protein RAS1_42220 [Phycisphaerae bacterium RAS1]|nr:hypothetical protein RAS1_42220 [Phycisphaerae bacterium RAS1]